MDNGVPYHYCGKCGDQLAVTNWSVGLCDACNIHPKERARITRLTSGSDLMEEATKRLRKARDIRKRAAGYENLTDQQEAARDVKELQTSAAAMRTSRDRIKVARAEKKRTGGAFLRDGLMDENDKSVNKQTGRRCKVRLHHYRESPYAYRTEGSPHKAKALPM